MSNLNSLYLLLLSMVLINCDDNTISVTSSDGLRGNGVLITQKRIITDYSELYIKGSYNVMIDSSSSDTVTIEGEENILTRIKTEKTGKVLKIYPDTAISCTIPITIKIKKEDLAVLDLLGESTVKCNKMENEKFNINIIGDARIDLAGEVNSFSIGVDGKSNIDASKFSADSTRINILGSAEMKIFAKKYLNVKIKGTGEIHYSGNPVIVKDIYGTASITENQEM